jgi:hypothetical protein
VIENKVAWGGVTEQPHRINLHGSSVVFEEKPRSVKWQHLLEVLSDLVERDLVFGAERLLISDFLTLLKSTFHSSVRTRHWRGVVTNASA